MGHATNPGPWRCIEPRPGDGHLPGKRRGLIGKFTSATLEKTRLNPGPRMCDNEKCIYSPNRRRRLIFVLQVRWASAAPDAGRGSRDREICRPALRDFQYFPIHTPPSRRRFFFWRCRIRVPVLVPVACLGDSAGSQSRQTTRREHRLTEGGHPSRVCCGAMKYCPRRLSCRCRHRPFAAVSLVLPPAIHSVRSSLRSFSP